MTCLFPYFTQDVLFQNVFIQCARVVLLTMTVGIQIVPPWISFLHLRLIQGGRLAISVVKIVVDFVRATI